MATIINSCIIISNDGMMRSKEFKGFDAARRSCTCDYTAAQKQFYLNGGRIVHVENDIVIASVIVTHAGEGMMYFSSVHLENGGKKFEEYIKEHQQNII